jgi:hypothetical protein
METWVPILMHGLGLLGMAGVLLVPMRIWSLIVKRQVAGIPIASGGSIVATFLVAVAIFWSLYMAAETMPVVFRCLYSSRCTSNLAGGLLNLALFGFSVAIVEVLWHGSRILVSRGQHAT